MAIVENAPERAGLARLVEGSRTRTELIERIRQVVNSLAVFPQPRGRSSTERRRFVARFLLPSITAAHDLPPMEVC